MVREFFPHQLVSTPAGVPAIHDRFDETLLETKMHLFI